MRQVFAIGVGGAVGSVLRYWLSTWVSVLAGRGFPFGTLAVNVVGCLAMGVLFVSFTSPQADHSAWRAGVLIGVLGGFTTFSAFSMETFGPLERGELLKATINVLASVVLCVSATWLGVVIAKQF